MLGWIKHRILKTVITLGYLQYLPDVERKKEMFLEQDRIVEVNQEDMDER